MKTKFNNLLIVKSWYYFILGFVIIFAIMKSISKLNIKKIITDKHKEWKQKKYISMMQVLRNYH